MEPTVGMWVKQKHEGAVGKIIKMDEAGIHIECANTNDRVEYHLEHYEEVDPLMHLLEKLYEIEERLDDSDNKFDREIDEIKNILRSHRLYNHYY